jgi:hypothetical protein
MKIITWNCQGAYRKKANLILDQNPDILIVPECEAIEKLQFELGTSMPNDSYCQVPIRFLLTYVSPDHLLLV